MSFINWGGETPEQKEMRRRYEEEQMLFEQAVRFARTTGAMAGAAGSGSAESQPSINLIFTDALDARFSFICESEEPFELNIDWGDGTKEKITVLEINGNSSYFNHTYSNRGDYEVKVKSKGFNTIIHFSLDDAIYLTGFSGLELLTSMQYLYMSNTGLTEFDQIAPLPSSLTYINISNSYQFTTFNPSHPLPESLDYLGIYGCSNFASFNPDQPLPNGLRTLNLSYNSLSSFNVNLPTSLTNLLLFSNRLTEFSPSQPLPVGLTTIDLERNELSSFNPIAIPGNTTYELNLSNNRFTSFTSDLSGFTSLQYLRLYNNQMTNFNPSQPIPNLYDLDLTNNLLTSFNPTHRLPNQTRYIRLSYNRLTSFNYSHTFPTSLWDLNLNNNLLTSFNPSNAFTSIERLRLHSNQITSFNPTHPFPGNFNTLTLQFNQISNFAPTVNLGVNLFRLELYSSGMTSIDLSALTNPNNNLGRIYFQSNALPVSEVNEVLVHLNNVTVANWYRELYLQQSPAAPPSGAGLTAKTSLQAKGFYVSTN